MTDSGRSGGKPGCAKPGLARLALAAVLFAALGAGGCGRKSGLDPPPVTQLNDPGQPGSNPGTGPDGRQTPAYSPNGPRKHVFLDWLID